MVYFSPFAAIGVEFGSRVVDLIEGEDKGKRVKLQIWVRLPFRSFCLPSGMLIPFSLVSQDTAGQVRLCATPSPLRLLTDLPFPSHHSYRNPSVP